MIIKLGEAILRRKEIYEKLNKLEEKVIPENDFYTLQLRMLDTIINKTNWSVDITIEPFVMKYYST